MKILVISLLRVGDLFLAAPVLGALRKKYPHASIHGLINKQCSYITEVIDVFDHVHGFERQALQDSLAQETRPIFDAFYRLDGLINSLHAENYDLVLNLTHNRLSGFIAKLVGGRETIGLSLDTQEKPQFGSAWFKYLNELAHARGQSSFHFADIFLYGCGLAPEQKYWPLKNNPEFRSEAEKLRSAKDYLVVQPFSSESKKEWDVKSWAQALLAVNCEKFEILILGAAFEKERLTTFTQALAENNVAARATICSLGVAREIIAGARLFLTVDTSIKHLGASTKSPIIELSLGSSDFHKTGVYRENALIVQPQVSCAPCPHSAPCNQAQHDCGLKLSPAMMNELIMASLADDKVQIERVARRYKDDVSIRRTTFSSGGMWRTIRLGQSLTPHEFRGHLDLLTKKLILQGEHLEKVGSFGTEALRLREWLFTEFPQRDRVYWSDIFTFLENENDLERQRAENVNLRLSALLKSTTTTPVVELSQMRAMQKRIEDLNQQILIRQRLVRSLKISVEEVI